MILRDGEEAMLKEKKLLSYSLDFWSFSFFLGACCSQQAPG
jgi:hypothetical protein